MSEPSSPSSSRPSSPVGGLPDIQVARPYRFHWDPSSRRPGPESVSGTTEGRGDYFGTQPRFDNFNVSSTALAFGTLPSEWSSSKHGFHAISTVLNNPHKRQAPPKAHSALPAVPPAELPRVRRKDFDSYLRAIAPEWERFERNTELGRDGAAQLDGPLTPRASLTSDDLAPSRTPLRIVTGRSMPPLDSVPSVFFETPFNLGDPRTFNTVTEQGDGVDGEASDPSSLSHSLPLLEKFSHYADTVEQHLVREISLRSTSFFAALSNLHELQSESEQCLDRISQLRRLLSEVDEKGAKRGLEVVRKESKMRNLNAVREGVRAVTGFVEMKGVAKSLIAAGQWGEALGIIEEMEALWTAGPEPLSTLAEKKTKFSPLPPTPESPTQDTNGRRSVPAVPLSSLQAFASLPNHLKTLTMEIASSLSSELVSVLRVDLVDRMSGAPKLQSLSKDVSNQSIKDRLRPLLHGLVRTKGIREATLSWREVVLGEIRGVIKQHLPLFDVNDADPNTRNASSSGQEGGLADHLRSMSHPDFLNLLQAIFARFLKAVEGLQSQGRVILEILDIFKSTNRIDVPALQEELTEISSSAAELSNTEAAKVISRRSEQHAVLELPEFWNFFDESWKFVVNCEVICRRMIVGLRGVLVSQAKTFLQAFHQARISLSAKLVEDEQWNPSEVSLSLQKIMTLLIDSAVRDPPELVLKINSSGPLPPQTSTANGASLSPPAMRSPSAQPPNKTGAIASTSAKHIRIEDRTYFLVSATSEVLILILDYLKVIINIPMLTTDTMSRIIEFLKAFNSRTCQVVLGAGAMRSAGLKNITAKHLALASQSLSIMIALIPYIRESFRRHLSSQQAVMLVEFDKLKRDYQEHQNEIHTKLIAIMGDRLTAHIKTLQGVNWEVPNSGGGVNDYMELLVKETVTLHKVLSRYLSTPIVEYVMTQVFAAINHRLSEEYGKIELPHQEAKTRLLADAKFLNQKLAALKNVGTPSGMLETVIAEKTIPRKPQPTPAVTFTPSANERLKGLLSGKSPVFDKALPTPTPTPLVPALPSTLPTPLPTSGTNGRPVNGEVLGTKRSSASPPPQPVNAANALPTAGFKQVESEEPLPTPEAGQPNGEKESLDRTAPISESAESLLASSVTSTEAPTTPRSASAELNDQHDASDVSVDGRSGTESLASPSQPIIASNG